MKQEKQEITKEQIEEVENYLKSYKFCQKLIMLGNYEKKYFETLEWEREIPAEFSVARAKMFEVRHFIVSMENSNEKLMLYYHYIHCDTVEQCAELMGISRSSAFRLKKRALEKAYAYSVREKKSLKAF